MWARNSLASLLCRRPPCFLWSSPSYLSITGWRGQVFPKTGRFSRVWMWIVRNRTINIDPNKISSCLHVFKYLLSSLHFRMFATAAVRWIVFRRPFTWVFRLCQYFYRLASRIRSRSVSKGRGQVLIAVFSGLPADPFHHRFSIDFIIESFYIIDDVKSWNCTTCIMKTVKYQNVKNDPFWYLVCITSCLLT